jgi:hypothetical protein
MVEDGHLEAEGDEGNIDKGVCPVCRKEEGRSDILQCEGTRVWRDMVGKKVYWYTSRDGN